MTDAPKFSIIPSQTEGDQPSIYIEDGEFMGTKFKFHQLMFDEDKSIEDDLSEAEYGRVNFNYFIETNTVTEEQIPAFETSIGLILKKILTDLFLTEDHSSDS